MRIIKKSLIRLNNMSLFAKFAMIFVFCIFLPILCSGLIYTVSTNSRISDEEQANMQREFKRIKADIEHIFDFSVRTANIISNDHNVSQLVCKRYSGQNEFYSEIISRDLKGYFGRYTSYDDDIESITVYAENDSIINGEVLSNIDEMVSTSPWYRAASASATDISMVIDEYRGYSTPTDNGTVCLIKRCSYKADGNTITAYVKLDLNINKLARVLDNKNEHMEFYLYSAESNMLVNPFDKELQTYGGDIREYLGSGNIYVIDEKMGNGNFLGSWGLAGKYDTSYARSLQLRNTLLMNLINLFFGIIGLVFVMLIYYSNKNRIELLKNGMSEMVNERFITIPNDQGMDEIGHLISTYNYMTDRMCRLINDVYKLEVKNNQIETERMRAEYRYLQSQVNPHFIFNTLSALQISALKYNCDELADRILDLARIIRRLLDWDESFRPLAEEIDFIRMYLNLEKLRFGEKFEYYIDTEEEALKHELPMMLIQPLIENSCRHGLQGKRGKRALAMSVSQSGTKLYIVVEDNGKGIAPEELREIRAGLADKDFAGHIGLKNIYHRLKLHFGDNADMDIQSEENEWTRIVVVIDFKEGEGNV